MSETGVQSGEIHERSAKALGDAHLQEALRSSTLRLYEHRLHAIQEVPGFDRLRERGREWRGEVMKNLEGYVAQLADRWGPGGGRRHGATEAQEAGAAASKTRRQAARRQIA